MERMQRVDARYQNAVEKRIKPFGSVVKDGEIAADPAVVAVVEAPTAKVALTGPQVYNQACLACHGGGIAGAPKTGDAADWNARIAKGRDVLNSNAINGFMGDKGMMPAKGGAMTLSDEEVIAAVDYLIEQVQ
ncbi:MAG: cytochrome c5 family protein [Gammaproteobacteria bacterium]|nr:c-type cytochrome [Gammaproteobacteria bacterium]NND55068.1 cytochrome c5 family protein [Gammaproteobacteria bacterium]